MSSRLFVSERVQIAEENLKKSFPEMPSEEINRHLHEMFIGLGESVVEMMRLDKYRTKSDLEKYFAISGMENIHGALEHGRGCIILTAHVGFWEAGTFFLPKLGFAAGVVAKPMRNPLVDKFFQRMRTAAGCYIIGSRKGARGILKALQKNHCVCILLDQHIKGPGSVVVPFFGRPAHTSSVITQMATRYQVPVVSTFVYRQPDKTYACHFNEYFFLKGNITDDGIRHNTHMLNQVIEQGIRNEISQWFWLHKRWRKCCEK